MGLGIGCCPLTALRFLRGLMRTLPLDGRCPEGTRKTLRTDRGPDPHASTVFSFIADTTGMVASTADNASMKRDRAAAISL